MPDVLLHGKKLTAHLGEAVVTGQLERPITGPATVTLEILDESRKLLRSDIFNSRTALRIDGRRFEFDAYSKSGNDLSVTFVSGAAAALRRKRGTKITADKTTDRTDFAKRLVKEVPWLSFKGDPGDPNKVTMMRGKNESTYKALTRMAEERQWRFFEDDDTVFFGSDAWLLDLIDPFVISEDQHWVDTIDPSYESGKRASSCTVQMYLNRWQARPGVPVRIRNLGDLAEGLWLVESISQPLFSDVATVSLVRRTPELPEPKPERAPDESFEDGPGGGTAEQGETSSLGYQWPVSGPITSGFGPRGSSYHYGVDIGAALGTPVKASKPGVVTYAGGASGYGTLLVIRHDDGILTRYGHMSSFGVSAGAQVGYTTVVGYVGQEGNATGPHLHFELRPNDSPVDPLGYLP